MVSNLLQALLVQKCELPHYECTNQNDLHKSSFLMATWDEPVGG